MIDSITIISILTVLGTLIIAITLHEAVHAYVAYALGDDTAKLEGRVTLNPIPHIDPVSTILLPIVAFLIFGIPILAAKPVPFNPARVKFEEFGSALIAVAGPLTNLLLALIAGGIYTIFGSSLGVAVADVFYIFILTNMALFVFNMIPIPPLDGSRVLYAFSPEPIQQFLASMERYGIFIVFALVLAVPAFGQFLYNLNQNVLNFFF